MSDRPISSLRPIHADCFTDSHRISCRILVTSMGVIGLLNDQLNTLVELEDIYMSRLQQPAKIIARFERMHLNKINLALVVLSRREDFGPSGLVRGGFSRISASEAMVTMQHFEVRGAVEYVNKFDAGAILIGGTSKFMPVYTATAVATMNPEAPYSGPIIIINRGLTTGIAEIEASKA